MRVRDQLRRRRARRWRAGSARGRPACGSRARAATGARGRSHDGGALHREQRGAHEQLERDARSTPGCRAGRTPGCHAGGVGPDPERERLARLHRDLVELELDAGRGERGAHVVAIADRHPAGRDHDVVGRARPRSARRVASTSSRAIPTRTARCRRPPRPARRSACADESTSWPGPGTVVDLDQLVAGRDQRDPRRAGDRHLGDAERGEHAEVPRREPGPGGEHGGRRARCPRRPGGRCRRRPRRAG